MTKDDYIFLQKGDKVLCKGQTLYYKGPKEIKSVIFDLFDSGDKDSCRFFYPSEVLQDDFIKL